MLQECAVGVSSEAYHHFLSSSAQLAGFCAGVPPGTHCAPELLRRMELSLKLWPLLQGPQSGHVYNNGRSYPHTYEHHIMMDHGWPGQQTGQHPSPSLDG